MFEHLATNAAQSLQVIDRFSPVPYDRRLGWIVGRPRPEEFAMRPLIVLCWISLLATSLSSQGEVDRKLHVVHLAPLGETLEIADFDGDGVKDLVAGVHVMFGVGGGRFLPSSTPLAGWFTIPSVGIPADLNGDGRLDLIGIIRGAGGGALYVWMEAAGRVFQLRGDVPHPPHLYPIVGDFDGDSDLDLMFPGQNLTTMWQNDGAGTFVANSNPLTIAGWVVGGDFDGDGDLDLADVGGAGVVIHVNDGRANFTRSAVLPGIASIWFVSPVDVDSDADLDLVLVVAGRLRVLINTGGLRFVDDTARAVPAGVPITDEFAVGDLDSDGDVDLVLTTSLQPLTNDGSGRFSLSPNAFPASGRTSNMAVRVVDVDGDGRIDVACLPEATRTTSGVRIFFQDASGAYLDGAAPGFDRGAFAIGGDGLAGDWNDSAFADLDLDGDPDVIVLGVRSRVGINSFGVGFVEVPGWIPDLNLPSHLALRKPLVGDFDGDGDPDVIASDGTRLVALRNEGGRSFSDASAAAFSNAATASNALHLGDFDGDGTADIVSQESHRLVTFLGRPGFSFVSGPILPAVAGRMTLVDLDGDGDSDIAWVSIGGGVLRNDGNGTFTDVTATWYPSGTIHWSLAFADVDGDGDQDSFSFGHSFSMLINDGSGRLTAVAQANPSIARLPGYESFVDVDGDGDPDLPGPYFTSGQSQRMGAFFNDGTGRMDWREFGGDVPRRDVSSRFVDFDGDGDVDLFELDGARETVAFRNSWRGLRAPYLARLGDDWPLLLTARPGTATQPKLAVGGLSTSPIQVRLPGLGFVRVDPGTFFPLPAVVIPAPEGRVLLTIDIPANPSLFGVEIWAQFVVADPEGSGFLSNVVREVLR